MSRAGKPQEHVSRTLGASPGVVDVGAEILGPEQGFTPPRPAGGGGGAGDYWSVVAASLLVVAVLYATSWSTLAILGLFAMAAAVVVVVRR